jgi:hypothetical protein
MKLDQYVTVSSTALSALGFSLISAFISRLPVYYPANELEIFIYDLSVLLLSMPSMFMSHYRILPVL